LVFNRDTEVVGASKFDDLWINAEDLPILFVVEGKKVTRAFLTENEIREELGRAMEGETGG
jgi:hypothetical protein